MKYRPDMTADELAQFKREIDELDAAYAAAAAFDAAQALANPAPDEWEDEMELLQKAALSRGRP